MNHHMPLNQLVLRTLAVISLAVAGSSAAAQVATPATRDSTRNVYMRARQMVQNGNGEAGRALVDSVVKSTPERTAAYAEALFWRASLARDGASAEHDYRRIIVEYKLSPRAPDALLALAQLEMSRGDRAAATAHLQRFLRDAGDNAEAGRATLWLGRLLLEQGDTPGGCAALARAGSMVSERQVELRNQIAYYGPRCVGVDTTTTSARPSVGTETTTAPARPSVAPAAPPTNVPERQKAEPVAAPSSARTYSVQAAAYESRPPAEKLATTLKSRGLDARVYGKTKPFRVRIGHYATRAEAVRAQTAMRAKGVTSSFVTVAEPEGK